MEDPEPNWILVFLLDTFGLQYPKSSFGNDVYVVYISGGCIYDCIELSFGYSYVVFISA